VLNTTRWPFQRILAHRGAGVLAPENTLVALRVAASLGFGGVEFDVKLAACGTPVLMHDETVDRTTDGSGRTADLDVAHLRRLDAGSWFGNEFAGEHVPTLEAAIALCRSLGLWANIEIKPDPGTEARTGQAVAALAARLWADASPAPLLSSFSETALSAAGAAAPALPRALLVVEPPGDWEARLRGLACRALHCAHEHIGRALVEAVHRAGFGLLAFTVNDAARAVTLFEWGVDAIVTDELREIRPDFLATYGICA
jgi:glycerophosphoryl diester phosphodiesterase